MRLIVQREQERRSYTRRKVGWWWQAYLPFSDDGWNGGGHCQSDDLTDADLAILD